MEESGIIRISVVKVMAINVHKVGRKIGKIADFELALIWNPCFICDYLVRNDSCNNCADCIHGCVRIGLRSSTV